MAFHCHVNNTLESFCLFSLLLEGVIVFTPVFAGMCVIEGLSVR